MSLHPYLVIRLALCRPELLKALQLDLFGGADVASEPRAQLSLFGGTVPPGPEGAPPGRWLAHASGRRLAPHTEGVGARA